MDPSAQGPHHEQPSPPILTEIHVKWESILDVEATDTTPAMVYHIYRLLALPICPIHPHRHQHTRMVFIPSCSVLRAWISVGGIKGYYEGGIPILKYKGGKRCYL